MKSPDYPVQGEPIRAAWGRQVVDGLRTVQPYNRRPLDQGMDWSLFPFGSIEATNGIIVFPGYVQVDGEGLWRLPVEGTKPDYTLVPFLGFSGRDCLVVMDYWKGHFNPLLRLVASIAGATSGTDGHYFRIIAKVTFIDSVPCIVHRGIGNKELTPYRGAST